MARGQPRGGTDRLPAHGALVRSLQVIEASAPLVERGFGPQIERNREIVERALRLVDDRAERASCQVAPDTLERADPPAGNPGRCSHKSTVQRRPWGDRSVDLGHEPHMGPLTFFLQSPLDRHFRGARLGTQDAAIVELLDAWIAELEQNYRDMVERIPEPWWDHGEVAFEGAVQGEPDGYGLELRSPAQMRVLRRATGEVGPVEAVATTQLVLDGHLSPQPDGIAPSPGERWWIGGHRLGDGSVMPCWATHRLVCGDADVSAARPAL